MIKNEMTTKYVNLIDKEFRVFVDMCKKETMFNIIPDFESLAIAIDVYLFKNSYQNRINDVRVCINFQANASCKVSLHKTPHSYSHYAQTDIKQGYIYQHYFDNKSKEIKYDFLSACEYYYEYIENYKPRFYLGVHDDVKENEFYSEYKPDYFIETLRVRREKELLNQLVDSHVEVIKPVRKRL